MEGAEFKQEDKVQLSMGVTSLRDRRAVGTGDGQEVPARPRKDRTRTPGSYSNHQAELGAAPQPARSWAQGRPQTPTPPQGVQCLPCPPSLPVSGDNDIHTPKSQRCQALLWKAGVAPGLSQTPALNPIFGGTEVGRR